jgi:hypothetical protein
MRLYKKQDPQHVRAVVERRRSNAVGIIDNRPRRKRTRQTAKHAAIRDQE